MSWKHGTTQTLHDMKSANTTLDLHLLKLDNHLDFNEGLNSLDQ